jgi:hypothetical protein
MDSEVQNALPISSDFSGIDCDLRPVGIREQCFVVQNSVSKGRPISEPIF